MDHKEAGLWVRGGNNLKQVEQRNAPFEGPTVRCRRSP